MDIELKHQADGDELTHMLRRAIHRIAVWLSDPVEECPFPGICITCHPELAHRFLHKLPEADQD